MSKQNLEPCWDCGSTKVKLESIKFKVPGKSNGIKVFMEQCLMVPVCQKCGYKMMPEEMRRYEDSSLS